MPDKNLLTPGKRDKQAKAPALPLFPDYQPYTDGDIAVAPNEEIGRPYGFLMRENLKLRRCKLYSIQQRLESIRQDDKVQKLCALLKTHVTATKEKVLIFVERHPTAVFVTEFLQTVKPTLAVECMVMKQKEGYALKDADKRSEIMDNFSPVSRGTKKVTFPVDVLICTDANGIGVDLQDANIVINYDPADSADILFQRAGRIIRFTDNPHRKIYLYTFKPTVDHPLPSKACSKIETVYENMQKHHDRSKKTFGLSILPESDETIVDLNNPDQEAEFIGSFHQATDSSLEDPLFHHTAIYEQHRELITTIRDGFYSSMIYKGKESRIVVLLKEGNKKPEILLYNLTTNVFEPTANPVSVLKFVACKPTQDNAPVSLGKVERFTQQAIDLWRKRRFITEETTTIFGLYLMPKSKTPFTADLLRDFIQLKKTRKDRNKGK